MCCMCGWARRKLLAGELSTKEAATWWIDLQPTIKDREFTGKIGEAKKPKQEGKVSAGGSWVRQLLAGGSRAGAAASRWFTGWVSDGLKIR